MAMRSVSVALGVAFIVGGFHVPAASANQSAAAECRVTTPNGVVATGGEANPTSYGVAALSTFGLPAGGVVMFRPGGPGFVTSDGSLGIKFPWQRGIRGPLVISGRRLDAAAPPLRAEVSSGYGPQGFQASYVIFPTTGCWEVTGRVADAQLTFVVDVRKTGDGPTWRRGLR